MLATASSLVTLRKAAGLLDASIHPDLKITLGQLCDFLADPTVRILVFGPFNYGKSTLLNALLGAKNLPIGLVATTGTAITLQYGPVLQTLITLTDGTQLSEAGTAILDRYAVLDDQRRMRTDVAAVVVSCPHPFLQSGVCLIDLPGTEDQAEQNDLIQQQLLQADLVIQLLDGRQLLTLGERQQLQSWLLHRGITSVMFVVNFLNLMDLEAQQQVSTRLRLLAEGFRTNLPAGISNLYRVDALPALRAQLKGDWAAAQIAGLPTLESALQTLVQAYQLDLLTQRWPRVSRILPQVKTALQGKIQILEGQKPGQQQDRESRRLALEEKAKSLMQKGFDDSIAGLRKWLALPHLLATYEADLALALQQFEFDTWIRMSFQREVRSQQQQVSRWVHKACEFFDRPRPPDLWLPLPPPPTVPPISSGQDSFKHLDPHGEAAHSYLSDFSRMALAALTTYKTTALAAIIVATTTSISTDTTRHQAHLDLLKACLADLNLLLPSTGTAELS